MWDIHNFKLTLASIGSIFTIIMGKVFAAINLPTLSTCTSLAGLIVAGITSVHLIVQIRKNLRETPPKTDKKTKRFFNTQK